MLSSVKQSRLARWLLRGTACVVLGAVGCGGANDAQEIPPSAHKALVKRKVDVEPRKSPPGKKTSRAQSGS